MPLLRNGQLVDENPWTLLEDDAVYPPGNESQDPQAGPLITSLERFLELEADGLHSVSGVKLKPDDDVTRLAEHLQRIQLIVIDFPQYTDGRGYSQARILRQQLHFSGELRAAGDVRPDQMLFMVRAGIDAFEFEQSPDEQLVKQALSRFRVNYQPSYALPVAG